MLLVPLALDLFNYFSVLNQEDKSQLISQSCGRVVGLTVGKITHGKTCNGSRSRHRVSSVAAVEDGDDDEDGKGACLWAAEKYLLTSCRTKVNQATDHRCALLWQREEQKEKQVQEKKERHSPPLQSIWGYSWCSSHRQDRGGNGDSLTV